LGLDPSEFLWLLHTNQLVSEVECIFERFFSKQHGVAHKSRLLINATNGAPGIVWKPSKAALLWLRFCSAIARIGCLHSLFGTLPSEICRSFGHGDASLKASRVFQG